ncbi:MAG: hypothetical protein ACREIP_18140, partial [Alphaproteobacteria bacterium]
RWPADAIPPGGVRPENAVYTSEDFGEIRHLFVVLTGRTIGPSRIGAAYPFVPHGTIGDVAIRGLHPHETGIAGEVSAYHAGAEIRFFEPLWGIKRNRYKPGTVQRIRFAAFGSALKVAAGDAKPETRDPAPPTRGRAAPPLPIVPSVMVPIGPGPGSRYGFHAPIVQWRGFWIGERLYYALKLRLAEDGQADFAVDVYAGRHCFNAPFSPAPGIALSGVIWLHGTLDD